jgi:uncharacterized membrane protein HdeD (DUF308 family)
MSAATSVPHRSFAARTICRNAAWRSADIPARGGRGGKILAIVGDASAQRGYGRSGVELAAGCFTLTLAIVALFLPDLTFAPRGGLVGWLLLLGGILEIVFGAARGSGRSAVTAIVAGLLTATAGLIFVVRPFAPYFSVANVVTLWLALRGLWVLGSSWSGHAWALRSWLAFSGLVDLMLAFLLLSGAHVSLLVVTLFGPTPEIVARFSLILMASFLATGMSQVAAALDDHRPAQTASRPR